jgi:hypothetical protein
MAAGGSTGWTGRRPWWVWAAPFTFLFVLLCVRNRFLFTTRLYEQGDAGANSKQFICTSAQAARGQAYWFYTPLTPPAAPVILRFSGVAVAPAPSS